MSRKERKDEFRVACEVSVLKPYAASSGTQSTGGRAAASLIVAATVLGSFTLTTAFAIVLSERSCCILCWKKKNLYNAVAALL